MATLEIFPNLSVYWASTDQERIDVPLNLTEVSAIDATTFNGVQVDLSRGAPFSLGSEVLVGRKTGELIELTDKFVEVGTKEGVIRIYHPDEIHTTVSPTKEYQIKSTSRVLLTGILEGIAWKPEYLVILGADPNILLNFLFSGRIQSYVLPFWVDQIIFKTRPVLSRGGYLPRLSAIQGEDQGEIHVDQSYRICEKTLIRPEISIPLTNLGELKSPRLYFLKLEEGAQASYGYTFEVTTHLPPAGARIFDQHLELIGETRLEVYGKEVFLRVGPEEKLLSKVIREEKSLVAASGEKLKKFSVEILSTFDSEVTLLLELETRESIVETTPPMSKRLPGKLIWVRTIPPGKTLIQVSITTN